MNAVTTGLSSAIGNEWESFQSGEPLKQKSDEGPTSDGNGRGCSRGTA